MTCVIYFSFEFAKLSYFLHRSNEQMIIIQRAAERNHVYCRECERTYFYGRAEMHISYIQDQLYKHSRNPDKPEMFIDSECESKRSGSDMIIPNKTYERLLKNGYRSLFHGHIVKIFAYCLL